MSYDIDSPCHDALLCKPLTHLHIRVNTSVTSVLDKFALVNDEHNLYVVRAVADLSQMISRRLPDQVYQDYHHKMHLRN